MAGAAGSSASRVGYLGLSAKSTVIPSRRWACQSSSTRPTDAASPAEIPNRLWLLAHAADGCSDVSAVRRVDGPTEGVDASAMA
jgi:hypothetical protein